MPTSEAVDYERSILNNIMREVVNKFSRESYHSATVETIGEGEYSFSLPAIPELPEGFYWSGYADSKYGARAFGWEAALKKLYHQSCSSANTSVNSTRTPAVASLVEKHFGWQPETSNLDFGCGKYPGLLTQYLGERHVLNLPLDPFNLPDEMNQRTLESLQSFAVDTVTLSNVLCVIQQPLVRAEVITRCWRNLKVGGRMYVTVYEGNGSGVGCETKPDCWQENRRTADYIPEIEIVFGAGNVRRHGKLLVADKRS